MYRSLILVTSTLALVAATAAPAQNSRSSRKRGPEPVASVGRAPMEAPAEEVQAPPPAPTPAPAPTTTVAQALPALPDHATLNKLIAATDLGATLAGPGPFTVFAPMDEAFARMPAGALDALLAPANKPSLTKILQYHVVPGTLTAEAIKAQITAGGGTAKLTTATGEQLTASIENGNVLLTDLNGQKAYVTTPDLQQTNGIVHVTNGVMFPKLG